MPKFLVKWIHFYVLVKYYVCQHLNKSKIQPKKYQVVCQIQGKVRVVKLRPISIPFALFFGRNSYLVSCEHRCICGCQEKNDTCLFWVRQIYELLAMVQIHYLTENKINFNSNNNCLSPQDKPYMFTKINSKIVSSDTSARDDDDNESSGNFPPAAAVALAVCLTSIVVIVVVSVWRSRKSRRRPEATRLLYAPGPYKPKI